MISIRVRLTLLNIVFMAVALASAFAATRYVLDTRLVAILDDQLKAPSGFATRMIYEAMDVHAHWEDPNYHFGPPPGEGPQNGPSKQPSSDPRSKQDASSYRHSGFDGGNSWRFSGTSVHGKAGFQGSDWDKTRNGKTDRENGPGDGGPGERQPGPPGPFFQGDGIVIKRWRDPNAPSNANIPAPSAHQLFAENRERMSHRRRPSETTIVSCLDITGKSFSENGTDQIIDRTGFEEALNNAPSHRTVRYQGALVRVCTLPVVYDKKVVGVVQAYEKLSYINTQLRQLTRAMLWICPFALIFVAGIGAFLTGRALRPVRDFTLAAQKITAKSMGERLPVQGNDEFSELALTFNGTLNRLQDAYCRLEESLEQQRRLTADASHELRTPLTVIKAHTSLSLTTPRTKEQYLNTIRAVDQAADIMARIVQDLLLLARADAGQLMVEHEPVSVEDLIESSVQTAKALEGAPISINKIDPELIVQGDAHLLMRVALNVLSNAKRHTPEGGQIGVRVNADAANISIVVADTGEGIAPEHLSHIGERFYRVDTARERTRGGTGLGLAICKTIISAHNGSLNIESELGKGTTVTIKLPRAKGEA